MTPCSSRRGATSDGGFTIGSRHSGNSVGSFGAVALLDCDSQSVGTPGEYGCGGREAASVAGAPGRAILARAVHSGLLGVLASSDLVSYCRSGSSKRGSSQAPRTTDGFGNHETATVCEPLIENTSGLSPGWSVLCRPTRPASSRLIVGPLPVPRRLRHPRSPLIGSLHTRPVTAPKLVLPGYTPRRAFAVQAALSSDHPIGPNCSTCVHAAQAAGNARWFDPGSFGAVGAPSARTGQAGGSTTGTLGILR